jgi:hypothetical protein
MQSICAIAAAILALAGPGECKAPSDGVSAKAGATGVHYARNGLPRLPSVPRLPSLPRVPKPKWP